MNKKPLLVVFLTVFIDLIGFGIIIPLSPYLAKQFGATQLEVGLLQSSFSIMQFFFAPFWGRLSDRYGRRPIMLISILGGVLSYTFFAFSTHLWMLFLARSLSGFFGGNISAAVAYIADITPKESRSKNMGLIGAAFGLGFIVGPLMGGLMSHYGSYIGSEPPFGAAFPALGAAVLCLFNFVFAFKFLKESRTERGIESAKQDRLVFFLKHLKNPVLGRLMVSFFLAGLAMAHMESMLFLYVKDVFDWSVQLASYGFAYVGVIIVFTQGYLIRKIMPKFGERRIMMVGLTLGAIGIGSLGFAQAVWVLAVANTALALGNGMANPSIMGSVSLLADKDEQGSTSGVLQSLSALGRILGPVSGGFLYQTLGRSYPFWVGGSLVALAVLLLLPVYGKLPQSGRASAGGAGH